MGSHDELKKIRDVLNIKGKCNVVYIDDTKYEPFYRQLLQNLKQFGDSPDCITTIDNYVFPIEHFELDSYKNNKKGSAFRKVEETFKNNFISTNGSIEYVEEKLEMEQTIDNIIKNFNKVFDDHYEKIKVYCENVKNSGLYNNYIICNPVFMIEVKDPFIPIGIDKEGNEREINLIYSDLLINKLETSLLNGMIVIYYTPEQNYFYILMKNELSLKIAKQNMYTLLDYSIKPKEIDMVAVAYYEEEDPETVIKRFRKYKINGFNESVDKRS